MTKRIILIAFLVALPVAAQAQSSSFGVAVGIAEPTADGLDFNLEDTVVEVFFKYPIDKGTSVSLKYGTLESDVEVEAIKGKGDLEYLDVVTAYEFDETYGSSSIFGGLGMYRQKLGDFEESDYGFTAGVNGTFPVSRKMALLAEIGYHWVHFEADTGFLMVTGGIQFNF